MRPAQFRGEQIDWKGAFTPRLLRDWADLIEFCYGNDESVDFGLLYPTDEDDNVDKDHRPVLMVGHRSDDKLCSVAPRVRPSEDEI